MSRPALPLCDIRLMFTGHLKKPILLGDGLAMEGLALMEQIDQPK